MFVLLGPLVGASAVAVHLLRIRCRSLAIPMRTLLPAFLRDVLGTGFVWSVILIVAIAMVTAITRSPQAMFWLLLGPWIFAVGELWGLRNWLRKLKLLITQPGA
jgi:hypothetical protein